jgi:hypothetical protein
MVYSLKLASDSVLEQHTITQSIAMWKFQTTGTVSFLNYLRILLNWAHRPMKWNNKEEMSAGEGLERIYSNLTYINVWTSINWRDWSTSVSSGRKQGFPTTGLDRPWGGRGSQISRQSPNEGGMVVNPKHRPSLLPRKYSWHSFLLQDESTSEP